MNVPFLSLSNSEITHAVKMLDSLDRHAIAVISWPQFNYQPEIYFTIAHDNHSIYVKYYVREESIRAFYRTSNEPVYKDSCVEFFVTFDQKHYYNFEFNSLGTCLMGFGAGRGTRSRVDDSVIKKIKRYAIIDNRFTGDIGELISWQLTVSIPLEVFYQDSIRSLKGKTAHANFYKCGDELPQPHYLAWNKIDTPQPDFHRPEFFGELKFE